MYCFDGTVEDKVIDCFYKGGGVPYFEYKRFHEVIAKALQQGIEVHIGTSLQVQEIFRTEYSNLVYQVGASAFKASTQC